MATPAELRRAIEAIAVGKSFGKRGSDTYYFIAHRPEGLVVEGGYTVPERDSDDPDSYTYNPFRGRPVTPAWVGRRQPCRTAEEAAEVYHRFQEAIQAHRLPTSGEQIGSVTR